MWQESASSVPQSGVCQKEIALNVLTVPFSDYAVPHPGPS